MADFEFKCRRCGDIESGLGVGDDYALGRLVGAIHNRPPQRGEGFRLSLIDVHACKDGNYGVSDLIGYRVRVSKVIEEERK